MKILIANIHYYPIGLGGAEKSIKILAEKLVLEGHEVRVYCIDADEQIKIEDINGVKIYRKKGNWFDTNQRHSEKSNFFKDILNKFIELRNYSIVSDFNNILDEFKPDVVYTNNLTGISVLVWKLVKKKNIKLIHTLRDYWLLSIRDNLNSNENIIMKTINIIYRKYIKNMSKYVDVVTAPSLFTLNQYKQYEYFENANYIHINNAIDIDINETKEIIEKRLNIKNKKIKFLYIGNLSKIKGLDILLRVFTKNKLEHIELNIYGSGQLEGYINEMCCKDNRIKFHGRVAFEEIKRTMKECDVVILPSVWDEPFGRVLIEGFQYGMVCIGSNRGGIPDIIKTMKCGRIIDIKKENDLEEAIKYYSNRENINLELPNIYDNILNYSIKYQVDELIKCMK